MGVDTKLYEIVLALHIIAVVIGFGGIFMSGLYGVEAGKRAGREGLAVGEASVKVTALAPTMAAYTVPVLGILLILLSDDTYKFSEAWVGMSLTLYIALIVLQVVVQAPNSRKIVALRAAAGGEMTTEVRAVARNLATVGGIINLLWVVVLFLMVLKPGH